ncbi:MAG: hypothetical protein QG579_517 [Patescibacteria group bacterium]|nr:hypothetical protein [Patescibacteria group bacterium]
MVECTAFEKRQAQKASGVRISPSPQFERSENLRREQCVALCVRFEQIGGFTNPAGFVAILAPRIFSSDDEKKL